MHLREESGAEAVVLAFGASIQELVLSSQERFDNNKHTVSPLFCLYIDDQSSHICTK